MKIRNYNIPLLADVLYGLKLKGKESRMRTRFRKMILEHYANIVEPERLQLIEEYAVRDENGEILYEDEEKTRITLKADFYSEFNELINEYYIIEENETNKDMLLNIAQIMLNADYDFSEDLADLYDIWCDEFEKIIEQYEERESE